MHQVILPQLQTSTFLLANHAEPHEGWVHPGLSGQFSCSAKLQVFYHLQFAEGWLWAHLRAKLIERLNDTFTVGEWAGPEEGTNMDSSHTSTHGHQCLSSSGVRDRQQRSRKQERNSRDCNDRMNLHLTDNQHIFHFIRIVPNLALPEY